MARIINMDTPWAIILPAVGSSLGLYLMKQFMEQVPDDLVNLQQLMVRVNIVFSGK